MNLLVSLALAKKKHLKLPACLSAKIEFMTNNLLFVYDIMNKCSCIWEKYERLHKYRSCESREYRIENCKKKKLWVDIKNLSDILLDSNKIVYIDSFIAMNNDFSLLKFMNIFSCLFAPSKPNTTNRF